MKLTSHLSRLGHAAYFRILRAADRLFGPGILAWLIAPEIALTCLNYYRDLPQLRRLRAALPLALWRNTPAARHFIGMYRAWISCILVYVFYDRLASTAWRKRYTIRGTPPHLRPDWKQRPFIIAFLHTGGFPVLRDWLRAQHAPTAFYLIGIHRVARHTASFRKPGDLAHGIEGAPYEFFGGKSLPAVHRFLTPGHILLVALEERDFHKPPQLYSCAGHTICLNRLAFRLALRTGAILMPASARTRGDFRFELTFGPPVPDALMHEDGLAAANQHLLDALWPDLVDEPADLTWTPLEACSPDLIKPRGKWP